MGTLIRLLICFAAIMFMVEVLHADESRWRKHDINALSPFEAAGVADFNGDGKLDVFCGSCWYEAPNWTIHKVRDVSPSPNPHYYEDFADAPLDVNGDGRMDIVTCAYFGQEVAWLENPSDPTRPWKKHLIDTPGSMETGYMVDLYGDGSPVFLPNVGPVGWYELKSQTPKVKWERRTLGNEGAGHGVGHGDINGDGRIDVIVPNGWYEQPPDRSGAWEFHPEFQLGVVSIEIVGHDFDGDGVSEIVWGMGHDFGLHWMKQSVDANGARTWTKEDIDTSFSQVHTILPADFDGDGQLGFVTGKRIYAHPSERGATDAPCIYAYRFDRDADAWSKEVVYEGRPATAAPATAEDRDALVDFTRGSAGTGLRMVVRDLDSDGDQDIVAPGKSGLYWFENLRIAN